MNIKTLLSCSTIIISCAISFVTSHRNIQPILETGSYESVDGEEILCIKTDIQCDHMGTQICSYFDGTTSQSLKRFVNQTQCGIQFYKAF